MPITINSMKKMAPQKSSKRKTKKTACLQKEDGRAHKVAGSKKPRASHKMKREEELEYSRPRYSELYPRCGRTLKGWLEREHKVLKVDVDAASKIFSFDFERTIVRATSQSPPPSPTFFNPTFDSTVNLTDPVRPIIHLGPKIVIVGNGGNVAREISD